MTLDTFFKKFDIFTDAPDAVARMRELVLQLAVRGELVPQNPQDEPVGNSIEKIVSLCGSGRAAKLFADEDSIELPFAIPASWKWVRFGDLVRIRTGKLDANAAVEGGAYPFFTCSKTPSQIATFSFDTSAVILAGNGDFNLKSYSGKFDAYQRTYVIEPIGWELGFCFWLVSAQIKRITNNQRGSAIPYLRLGDIADPLVPFPPLAEQKRIVAKVDELMVLCDRLEAQQQERGTRCAELALASLARFAAAPTPANLNLLFHKSYTIAPADLRKSILTLAVQGKLIRFESRHAGKTVGDHIEFLNGYAFKSEWFKPKGVRLCRNVNVSHGVIDWRESVYVDDDVAKEFERFVLREGDIVLSLDRPLITTGLKVARVRQSDLPCLLLQRVAKPVPKHDQLDLVFFLLWLNSSEFVDTIDPGRSNGVPHISTRQVQSLPFLLPLLAEQRRIVAKVEQLMALVDELETRLAASRSTAKNLLDALVAELTAQPLVTQ